MLSYMLIESIIDICGNRNWHEIEIDIDIVRNEINMKLIWWLIMINGYTCENYELLWLWLDMKSMLDIHVGNYDWYCYVDYILKDMEHDYNDV